MKPILFASLWLSCLLPGSWVAGQTVDSMVTNRAGLYYEQSGQGNPILCLSGGPGIAGAQLRGLAELLSTQGRVVLPDQRGTGRSWARPLDSSSINLDTAITDLERLRLQLGLESWIVLGHSWGGMLGAAYAARYPQRVKALVVVGGGELNVALSPAVDAATYGRRQWADTAVERRWRNADTARKYPQEAALTRRRMAFGKMIFDPAKLEMVMREADGGKMNGEMSRLMWKDLYRRNFDVVAAARAYKGPVLLMLGWQDPVGITTLHQYIQAFPQAEVAGINRAGHFVWVEQGAGFLEHWNRFVKGLKKD